MIYQNTFPQKKTEPDKTQNEQNNKNKNRDEQIRSCLKESLNDLSSKEKKKIIETVLKAKNKQQINLSLMEFFSSERAGMIYKKLKPFLKDMP